MSIVLFQHENANCLRQCQLSSHTCPITGGKEEHFEPIMKRNGALVNFLEPKIGCTKTKNQGIVVKASDLISKGCGYDPHSRHFVF